MHWTIKDPDKGGEESWMFPIWIADFVDIFDTIKFDEDLPDIVLSIVIL